LARPRERSSMRARGGQDQPHACARALGCSRSATCRPDWRAMP
jgi:hypothetical protein